MCRAGRVNENVYDDAKSTSNIAAVPAKKPGGGSLNYSKANSDVIYSNITDQLPSSQTLLHSPSHPSASSQPLLYSSTPPSPSHNNLSPPHSSLPPAASPIYGNIPPQSPPLPSSPSPLAPDATIYAVVVNPNAPPQAAGAALGSEGFSNGAGPKAVAGSDVVYSDFGFAKQFPITSGDSEGKKGEKQPPKSPKPKLTSDAGNSPDVVYSTVNKERK